MSDDPERKDESEGGASVSSCSYHNPWMYLDKYFESDDIGSSYGFVYQITNKLTGKSYIGRKYFWSKRKPRNGKRRVQIESDWKKYYGSCPELKDDVRTYGKECFSRTILSTHCTPGRVNFEETRQLFINNVLTEALEDGNPAFYNSNILGRYFRKDYFGS